MPKPKPKISTANDFPIPKTVWYTKTKTLSLWESMEELKHRKRKSKISRPTKK